MPEYCYIPIMNGTMLRVRFGNNIAEPTDIKGDWPEALDLNLEQGINAAEAFSMYICFLFNHWPMYDYLMNLTFSDLLAVLMFIVELGKTGISESMKGMNRDLGEMEMNRGGILH